MGEWTSHTSFDAEPGKILEMLTDPHGIKEWSPIDFKLEDFEHDRLHTGAIAHVAGSLAGRRMSFDVEVFKASDGQFKLKAKGPVHIDVEYGIEEAHDGSGK